MTLENAKEKYGTDHAFLKQCVTCLKTAISRCQPNNSNQQQPNPSGIFLKFALLNATAKKIAAATTIKRVFRAFQIRKNTINKENAPPRNKTTSVTQNHSLQELINQQKNILKHHNAAVDNSFFGGRHKNRKGNNKKAHTRKRKKQTQETYKL